MKSRQVNFRLHPLLLVDLLKKKEATGHRSLSSLIVAMLEEALGHGQDSVNLVRRSPNTHCTRTVQFWTTPAAGVWLSTFHTRLARVNAASAVVAKGLKFYVENPHLAQPLVSNRTKKGTNVRVGLKLDGKLLTLCDKFAAAQGLSMQQVLGLALDKGVTLLGATK